MLKQYGRKLGPKPASIDTAKIRGIADNNASGANYSIKYNNYNTVKSMRIIFANETILNIGNENS